MLLRIPLVLVEDFQMFAVEPLRSHRVLILLSLWIPTRFLPIVCEHHDFSNEHHRMRQPDL